MAQAVDEGRPRPTQQLVLIAHVPGSSADDFISLRVMPIRSRNREDDERVETYIGTPLKINAGNLTFQNIESWKNGIYSKVKIVNW